MIRERHMLDFATLNQNLKDVIRKEVIKAGYYPDCFFLDRALNGTHINYGIIRSKFRELRRQGNTSAEAHVMLSEEFHYDVQSIRNIIHNNK